MTTVLVLAGGPDAERAVSLKSGEAVAEALRRSGRYRVVYQVIDAPTLDELRATPGDVIFPALHGKWGEGGPLQDLLVADGRPFVGCGPRAARLAMDKVATKAIAQSIGVATTVTCVLEPRDSVCPLPFPVVAKPIHEGSTIGLFVCRSDAEWRAAHGAASESGRPYMIEPFISGREITAGMVDGIALPLIEIIPAEGLYDYDAKYTRNDTRYTVHPALPPGSAHRIATDAARLAQALGVRHLCRADFLLDAAGAPWLLEMNTLPGFTDHSLVPMAAASAQGAALDMAGLCSHLVELALRDSPRRLASQERTAAWQSV